MASPVSCGLLQDRSGALWIGTYGDGLYRLDMRRLTDRDGDSFRPVRALTEDHQGRLYAATRTGVQLVGEEGMRPCPDTERIQGNEVRSVYVDRQDRLWIGLWGGQIFVRQGETVHQLPAPSFENSPVQFLEDRAGRVWIGSLFGMAFGFVLDGRLHTLRPDEAPRWVGAMALDGQGRLWVGASRPGGGLHYYTGRRFETHPSLAPLTTCRILSLCWADETLWIGANRGLYRWKDEQLHPELTRADLTCPIITALCWTEGRLWIGTEGAGVYIYDGHHLRQPEAPVGMDAEVIWALHPDRQGRLWGATAGGLRTYDLPPAPARPVPPPCLADLREQFLGTGPAIEAVREQVRAVIGTDLSVLLLGETGTGKTLLARLLHQCSPRRNGPFVAVNCSALPANLIEAELFGYEQGAFTGALARKIGRFERAEGGTLFLDEIGDLSVELQAKLLHVLQDGTYERVGGTATLQADVRLLYATHQDLKRAVDEGRFREDLFWRVHVCPIRLPALRERKADIPLLARRFLEQQAQQWGWPTPRLTPAFMEVLQAHAWPGNVRELENILRQVLLRTRGAEVLDRAHVQGLLPARAQVSTPLTSALANLQAPDVVPRDELLRMYYQRVCELTRGAIYGERGAGRLLGLSGETLTYWLKKLGLK